MNAPAIRHVNVAEGSSRQRVTSDAVVCGELAYVNGLGPVDLTNDRKPLPEMVEDQVARIFTNLDLVLERAGIRTRRILCVQARLVDLDRLIERFDAAYIRSVGAQPMPTRGCSGVQRLTRGALVEMDFVLHTSL